MPWARLDDTLWRHEKVNAAGPLGLALFAASLSYCNDRLTDGFIPDRSLWQLVNFQGLSDEEGPVTPQRVADRLVEAGLWEREEKGYRIHDYLHYNKTKDQILEEREEARVRMQRFRSSAEVHANIERSSETPGSRIPYPDPGTRIPDPEPEPETSAAPTVLTATDVAVEIMSPVAPLVLESPKPARKAKTPKTAPEFSPDCLPYQLAVYQREAILRTDPTTKVPPEKGARFQKWCEPIDKLLRSDHREPDEIRAVIDFSQADEFWQPNVLCPGKLREKYDTLKRQMVRNRAPPASSYARPPVSNGSPKGGLTPDEARALERLGIRKVAPAGGAGPGSVQPAL